MKDKVFNLEYWVGSSKKETIFYSKPKPLCLWKKKELLKGSAYKMGIFKVVEV